MGWEIMNNLTLARANSSVKIRGGEPVSQGEPSSHHPSELGDIRVDLPPITEQRRIADSHDAETTQINALVTEK